jgi:hypothetical protein
VIKLIFGLSHNIKSIILSTYVSGPFATSEKEKKTLVVQSYFATFIISTYISKRRVLGDPKLRASKKTFSSRQNKYNSSLTGLL